MQIDVHFNAVKNGRSFQHVVGRSILDSEDPFDAGCERASAWCRARNSRLVSVSFVNKFDDTGGQFLGTVTARAAQNAQPDSMRGPLEEDPSHGNLCIDRDR